MKPTNNVVSLTKGKLKASSVEYTVRINHYAGGLTFSVDGIRDARTDRLAVAGALRAVVTELEADHS